MACKGLVNGLYEKIFQMETALRLKFKVALIGKRGKYMLFYLCGYIVNARQWKTSEAKEKKASESKESTWEVRLACFLASISAKLSRLFRHN